MQKFQGIDPQSWGRVLRARRPVKTARCVAADCRVPAKTVEKWLSGEVSPSSGALIRLILAYGPGLLADLIPTGPSWISRAALDEQQAVLEARRAALEAEISDMRRRRGGQ